MPTARELLEQADALMRRNRSPIPDDIPVLTDSVDAVPPPRALRGRVAAPQAREAEPHEADPIPTLTQAMAEEPPAATTSVVEEGEPSDWLQLGEGEPSVIDEAPDSIAIVPEVVPQQPEPIEVSPDEAIEITASSQAEDAFDEEITPGEVVAPPAEVESPVAASPFVEDLGSGEAHDVATAQAESVADEKARWDSVAEEIRMQVLQRIDLFTDTGLREQLGARLQPIVDRASADLVATINQHVGELLRAYVAEAIEREIVNWRQSH